MKNQEEAPGELLPGNAEGERRPGRHFALLIVK